MPLTEDDFDVGGENDDGTPPRYTEGGPCPAYQKSVQTQISPPSNVLGHHCRVCRNVGRVHSRFCSRCCASTICDKELESHVECEDSKRNPSLAQYGLVFMEIYARYHKEPFRSEQTSHNAMHSNLTGHATETHVNEEGVTENNRTMGHLNSYPDILCPLSKQESRQCLTCVKSRQHTINIGRKLFEIGYTLLRRVHRSDHPRLYKPDGTVTRLKRLKWLTVQEEAVKDRNAELLRIIKFFKNCAAIRGLNDQIKEINAIVKTLDKATRESEEKEHHSTFKDNYSALKLKDQNEFEDLHGHLEAKEKNREFYYLHSVKQIKDLIYAWKENLNSEHSADRAKAEKMSMYAGGTSARSRDIFKPLPRTPTTDRDKSVDQEKMLDHTGQKQTSQHRSSVDEIPSIDPLALGREAVRISYIIFEGYECPLPRCDNMEMNCPACTSKKVRKPKLPTETRRESNPPPYQVEIGKAGENHQNRRIDRMSNLKGKVLDWYTKNLLTVPDPKVRR